ncbi:MAG: YggT family protein [Varibaculum sp.]|nr:YggT family protein [Varibaculum sp.]
MFIAGSIVASLLFLLAQLLSLYGMILLVRVLIEWIVFFSHNSRPPRALMLVANIIYKVTDPPVNLADRLIPPVRVGNVGLRLGILVLFFVLYFLIRIINSIALTVL